MIDLNFGLWWSGSKLSYLRYLTFKSLRHFHPHSRIQLFTTNAVDTGSNSGISHHDFLDPNLTQIDYMSRLVDLGVEIVHVNAKSLGNFYPHQQADIYRWVYLKKSGGIYLDPDQIILKSFKSLPIKKYDFLYSSYKVDSPFAMDGRFSPIGVLGASPNSKVVSNVSSVIMDYKKDGDYNSMGVVMMSDVIGRFDFSEGFNAPSNYFYPAPICDYMNGIYDGTKDIPEDSYALHWYGGYEPSQKFNKRYTEEFSKSSKDTISKFLRGRGII